jgi:hypothetical protein
MTTQKNAKRSSVALRAMEDTANPKKFQVLPAESVEPDLECLISSVFCVWLLALVICSHQSAHWR